MFRIPAHARRFLRLAALMLLVLSVLARPMLEQLGGLHAAEHAIQAAADAGDGDDHASPERAPGQDPAHAGGFHGLMHQAECGAAAALLPAWGLALAGPSAVSPPLPEAMPPRSAVPATLFRPPIA